MATQDEISHPLARWIWAGAKKLGMPRWLTMTVMVLLLLAAVAVTFYGLALSIPFIGHKKMITFGTILITIGGLLAAIGEAEPIKGRRERKLVSEQKNSDRFKLLGFCFVFVGGLVLSFIAWMDAAGTLTG